MRNKYQTENPFASPLAEDPPPVVANGQTDDYAESVRRELLNHEASIKSIGMFFLIGCVFFFAMLALTVYGLGAAGFGGGFGISPTGAVAIPSLAGITALYCWIGIGLRILNPTVRIPAILVSLFWLVVCLFAGEMNVLGFLFSVYFLYVLACEKGGRVLSTDYQAIVAATPHIRYKTSRIVWGFVALLGFILLAAIVGLLLEGSR